ncbi:MAG: xanthine dehydrogenase family protein molybdopterin-binding subunit, partial [Longimicrobiales bacterium]
MAELIGKDFTPPDVRAKVTGAARYAEDFRMDGMLHCRLLKSPMPHAIVRGIDARRALSLPGVVAILTADEVPAQTAPANNILTNEPHFVGEPILAVAAESEEAAQNAIDAIELDLEPQPFCTDPLHSLRPDGPNARTDGNTFSNQDGVFEHKWTEADFAAAAEGEMPMGPPATEWAYGDLDAGFEEAALILDESFVT